MVTQDTSIPEYTSRVFISYSRKDRILVEPIIASLESINIDILRDTDDILPTEEWQTRLEQLIVEADQVVFALSPNSAASEVCQWEAELAASLNKRIAPIVISELGDISVPKQLSKLNYIFMTPPANIDDVLTRIHDALMLDIDWVREHAKLCELSRNWDLNSKRNDLFLRGKSLEAAETWAATHPSSAPEPTATQLLFIQSSRAASTRRLRRNIGVLGVLLAVAVGTAGIAWFQYTVAQASAEKARQEANFSSRFTGLMLDSAADPLRSKSSQQDQKDCDYALYRDDDGQLNRYGLLATFCAMRNVLGLKKLASLSGHSIFLSGPHTDTTIDNQQHYEFGYYNPAFVNWFSDRVIPDASDTDFINSTRAMYDEFAKYLVRSFYLTFINSANHPKFFSYERRLVELQITADSEQVKMLVDNTHGPSLLDFYDFNSEFAQIEFDFESIGFDKKDITHLTDNSFNESLYDLRAPIRYWTRRSIDGTADEVYGAIRKLIRAYDSEYTERYESKGLADVRLPEFEKFSNYDPVLLNLPIEYRRPWGDKGENMPERFE